MQNNAANVKCAFTAVREQLARFPRKIVIEEDDLWGRTRMVVRGPVLNHECERLELDFTCTEAQSIVFHAADTNPERFKPLPEGVVPVRSGAFQVIGDITPAIIDWVIHHFTGPYTANATPATPEDPYFTAKRDSGKLRFDLVPVAEMEALADIFTFGAEKYGPNTWPNVPDAEERYYAAALRHLTAWRKGISKDEESGKPHLAHAFWNLGALLMLNEGFVKPKQKESK